MMGEEDDFKLTLEVGTIGLASELVRGVRNIVKWLMMPSSVMRKNGEGMAFWCAICFFLEVGGIIKNLSCAF